MDCLKSQIQKFTISNKKGVVALKLIEGDSLIKVLFMNQEKIAFTN